MSVEIENNARIANSKENWDKLWSDPHSIEWRQNAMDSVYDRIVSLIKPGSRVVDVGGGVGMLAKKLHEHGCDVEVWEHSAAALHYLTSEGIINRYIDLEDAGEISFDGFDVVVATEVLEHLSEAARNRLLKSAALCGRAFITVPNDRLGPDEEPQHTVKFTAKTFLDELGKYFPVSRVECSGVGYVSFVKSFLLGICGIPKSFKMSVCFPARDEALDIERTLASFRGVADELIVGIDPRTADETKELAKKYCDLVFDLENPEAAGTAEQVPEGGVHFSNVRNQCIEKCTGDWIFMTEGHEHLYTGVDTLQHLDVLLPKAAQVGFVLRQGNGQQWGFPWLFKNEPRFRFKRSTHNVLDYPDGTYTVRLPQVVTVHSPSKAHASGRKEQRKVQNRKTLFDDWLVNKNENSLYYLGSEWREFDNQRSIRYLEQYLQTNSRNGAMRYQTKLILAKTYRIEGDHKKAKEILLRCVEDDWNRSDHWIWLGDIAFEEGKYEESLQYYRYASTMIGTPPFTLWWIDLANYSYLPAQRLAMVYGELELFRESLYWARRVKELLPDDAPSEAVEETDNNIKLLEEAVQGNQG